MKPSRNPYESLRQPGIRGQAKSYDYDSTTIFNTSALALVVHTGELIPGVWDFGYSLTINGNKEFKAPGEGQGWFRSRSHAILYALGMLRMRFHLHEEISMNIDKAIGETSTQTLF